MHKELTWAAFLAWGFSACAANQPPKEMSASEKAYCAIVADSVATYSQLDSLPRAQPVGRPRLPRVPSSVMPGQPVTIDFLVRPDGEADTLTLRVSGVSDVEFHHAAIEFATHNKFAPAKVQDCPVVSHFGLIMKSLGIERSKRN